MAPVVDDHSRYLVALRLCPDMTMATAWGVLWHLDGEKRERRNEILRARDTRDYSFVDWLYSITALTSAEEPPMFQEIPLDTPTTAPVV